MKALSAIKNGILGLVYPPCCGICKKALTNSGETGVCDACLGQIKRQPKPYCALCGHALNGAGASGRLCADCRAEKPSFSAARSACVYEGVTKELIHLFKYKNKRSLAGLFAQCMLDAVRDDPVFAGGIEAVTFVPLHRKRLRERDFNQSEALATRIAGTLALPVTDCLEKIRHTSNQNELSRRQRLVNLKGAFRVRNSLDGALRDRTVLLVDDVMTTGATLDECSRRLLIAGAREVRCLTAARGMQR